MKELIVSIPHTGTRFLLARLGHKNHIHVNMAWEAILRETKGYNLIAPLRDPTDTWKSHVRRWNPWDTPHNTPRFVIGWYMMHALSLVKEIEFIPVDLHISSRITDWTPVRGGADEQSKNNTHSYPYSLSHIYSLPFVRKYYKVPK